MPALKSITPGCEQLAPGHTVPRHRHLAAYAILVVRGEFEQDGYAGRVRVRAGDLLLQPTLDAHANRTRGATILRLPWPAAGTLDLDDLGGVHTLPDPDLIIRTADRDLPSALAAVRAQLRHATPRRAASDAPDQLAVALTRGAVPSLAAWAASLGIARETLSRDFTSAFGVSARQFRAELRARAAWLRIVRTDTPLSTIAAATGFADQAHMTRHIRALTGAPPSAWRHDPRTAALRPSAVPTKSLPSSSRACGSCESHRSGSIHSHRK
jgi:AraC-like DNA-binding protein